MTARTAVYRFFDKDDQLLYVGVAKDPERRWAKHASDKDWWSQVARKTTEWHDTRAEALAAEATAIREDWPKYNVTHNVRDRAQRAEARQAAAERAEAAFKDAVAAFRATAEGAAMSYGESRLAVAEALGDGQRAAYWRHVVSVVSQAPPLSPEQIGRLRVLLHGSSAPAESEAA